LKHRRENKLIACLDCWECNGWMGPNHITLRDGGATCGICGKPNPLANMRRMTMLDLTEPRLIGVPWTRSGTARTHSAQMGKPLWVPGSSFHQQKRSSGSGVVGLDRWIRSYTQVNTPDPTSFIKLWKSLFSYDEGPLFS
jgi:hypothetical protein